MSKDQTAGFSNELSELLNKMTPRMTEKGFQAFKESLNIAVSEVINSVFDEHEFDAFHVNQNDLVRIKP